MQISMGRAHSQVSHLGIPGRKITPNLTHDHLISWKKGQGGCKVTNWDCHCHGPSETASDPDLCLSVAFPETQIFVTQLFGQSSKLCYVPEGQLLPPRVLHDDTCLLAVSFPTPVVCSLLRRVLTLQSPSNKSIMLLSCTPAVLIE